MNHSAPPSFFSGIICGSFLTPTPPIHLYDPRRMHTLLIYPSMSSFLVTMLSILSSSPAFFAPSLFFRFLTRSLPYQLTLSSPLIRIPPVPDRYVLPSPLILILPHEFSWSCLSDSFSPIYHISHSLSFLFQAVQTCLVSQSSQTWNQFLLPET